MLISLSYISIPLSAFCSIFWLVERPIHPESEKLVSFDYFFKSFVDRARNFVSLRWLKLPICVVSIFGDLCLDLKVLTRFKRPNSVLSVF